ncbi:Vta1 like-domain-containing protein [Lactarius pseudohatsudake]|nr:Vta1 like-domain-containing protein [Lactarius pseudohatsudake]
MSYLGLPPIPPDLKPITPYVQRAHETRAQDPIISYWCAYYAAQVGISLKAVGPPNRNFLAALLTMLESLRSTVGSSDAVAVESASSAYVENFALKVFASADDEDRRGAATRKTAKKFLAAATFFEVLNVFEDRGPWEAHEEKVRYSKWRAAEISKALREGRQPTPVVGGAEATAEPVSALPGLHEGSSDVPTAHVDHELEGSYSASAPAPASVPPTFAGDRSAPEEHSAFSLNTSLGVPPKSSPVPIHGTTASHSIPAGSPSPPSLMKSSSKSRRHRDSKSSPSSSPRGSPTLGQGRGRNTSLGSSSLTSSPTSTAQRSTSPTHFIPRGSPPSTVPYLTGTPYASAPPPPPPPSVPYAPVPPPPPSLLGTSPPPELTPGQIAKAQKHCRFAISALDYEDAEQARKELRSALAIIGG